MKETTARAAAGLTEKYKCPVDQAFAAHNDNESLREIALSLHKPQYSRRVGFAHSFGADEMLKLANGEYFQAPEPPPDPPIAWVNAVTDVVVALDPVPEDSWGNLLYKFDRPAHTRTVALVLGWWGRWIRDADFTMRSFVGHANIPTNERCQKFTIERLVGA